MSVENPSLKNSFRVSEEFMEIVRKNCQGVSYDQVNAVVCASKVQGWGCRRCGRSAKPPLGKDTALKILKLHGEYERSRELHESLLPKVAKPVSEEERLANKVDELRKRRDEQADQARLKDEKVRLSLEVDEDWYVLELIQNIVSISNPELAHEFFLALQGRVLTAGWLDSVLLDFGVNAGLLSRNYDYFKRAVLKKGFAREDDPELCLSRVIEWRMFACRDPFTMGQGSPIFYPGEFEEFRKEFERVSRHLRL